ncbi:hypothetical protein GCM10010168_86310 [Actinoplanes ianthinogenes]|uniref:Uncharacterized protein n=1 Tax=Actinoplanes ianthinogenes TaxID=122358 RepID=A0ABM7M174_9ACTN|nr:hypothetical protein [Actinoplanes ianthinogenes]BCJ45362.1 hypothetical protein Aiant_60190 [Actinoplanes ianthinogenes]GGR54019.1 hypothetical protein GCM10010168_86310 [Actinoplanes ianthinogenes]
MSLSIFDTHEVPVITPGDLDPHETITRRLTPPHLRRPLALAVPAERTSFAVLSDSGELPLVALDRPRPDETARIATGRLVDNEPDEPRRPWFFRGTRRLTRSRALVFAATWPGGLQ